VPAHALRAAAGVRLRVPAATRGEVHVQGDGTDTYFVAEVPVSGDVAPRPLPQRVGLLWDASASARKRDRGLELAVLERYFQALGNARVSLVVLRDRAEPVRRFDIAGGNWTALAQALKGEVFDGATNLGDWRPQADVEEYLLVSDGLGNYGRDAFPALGVRQRLFTLNTAGASADSARLQALAQAHGGRALELTRPAEIDGTVAALLGEPPRVAAIDAVGAQDVVAASLYPEEGVVRVAGRLTGEDAKLTLAIAQGATTRRIDVPLDAHPAPEGALLARAWAGYRLRELEAEPLRNRTQMRLLGQRYGIATRETSLIVLETYDDYVRYDIAPPAEWLAQFEQQRRDTQANKAAERARHLDEVVAQFAEKQAWWETDWARQYKENKAREDAERQRRANGGPPAPVAVDMSPPAEPMPAPAAAAPGRDEDSRQLETITVTGSLIPQAQRDTASPVVATNSDDIQAGSAGARTIHLQPWEPDSPFARRLRAAPAGQVYALYLDEREANADSTAFYLDVADILLAKGQRALALRVLSNLAEMQLENRHVLRVLGYRLLQAKAPGLAVPVLEQVRAMAEEEPQSFRDLGLALDAAGDRQAAIESLYEVVARPWDGRFGGIALIALAEMNAIVARAPRPLDTHAIDPRLLRNLPLALRAVLGWDADATDIDLWVTQPDGERAYYGHQRTAAGGRMSNDFTGGYGPEEFSLRRAMPGKYRVEANFFGSSASVVTGAVTLQLTLSTGFGTAQQHDEAVTLRLGQAKETVLVGEFEVK
jgi:hypothetical protein